MNNSDMVSIEDGSGPYRFKVVVWTPDGKEIPVQSGLLYPEAEALRDDLVAAIREWAPALVEDAREAESRRWYS